MGDGVRGCSVLVQSFRFRTGSSITHRTQYRIATSAIAMLLKSGFPGFSLIRGWDRWMVGVLTTTNSETHHARAPHQRGSRCSQPVSGNFSAACREHLNCGCPGLRPQSSFKLWVSRSSTSTFGGTCCAGSALRIAP